MQITVIQTEYKATILSILTLTFAQLLNWNRIECLKLSTNAWCFSDNYEFLALPPPPHKSQLICRKSASHRLRLAGPDLFSQKVWGVWVVCWCLAPATIIHNPQPHSQNQVEWNQPSAWLPPISLCLEFWMQCSAMKSGQVTIPAKNIISFISHRPFLCVIS